MQKLKHPIEFETTFNVYVAGELIGQGGAGRVYGAIDGDGVKVAVKVLSGDNVSRDKRKRFKNELAFLQRTTHANLVPVIDHGVSVTSSGAGPFYVMPRYDGSLRDLLKAGIAASDVIGLFGQLLNGVEAAHLLGAVHRDLKPENVLFQRSGNGVRLAIADFGVARFQPTDQATVVETSLSTRLANFVYAAPEQRRPGADASAAVDIFALGLILNEMFTGLVPHGTGFKHIADVHASLAYLDPIVDDMTRQDPAGRISGIEGVKQRLRLDHEEAMLKQRLGAAPSSIVVDSEVDDPLVTDPVRLIDVDWENGVLKLFLSKPVNQGWIHALHHMGSSSHVMGAPPTSFHFSGKVVSVSAGEHMAQQVIDHFKTWLPVATRVYKDHIIRARSQEAQAEINKLREQRERDGQRLRVVQKLQI